MMNNSQTADNLINMKFKIKDSSNIGRSHCPSPPPPLLKGIIKKWGCLGQNIPFWPSDQSFCSTEKIFLVSE